MRRLLCLLFLSLALVGTAFAQNYTIPVRNVTTPAPRNITITINITFDPFTSSAIPEIPEFAFDDATDEFVIDQTPEDRFEIEQTEQAESSPENVEIAQGNDIQPIITQPVLRRVTREQPITQQQMIHQNIVNTREITEPEIREELHVVHETRPMIIVDEVGPPLPRLTLAPGQHD